MYYIYARTRIWGMLTIGIKHMSKEGSILGSLSTGVIVWEDGNYIYLNHGNLMLLMFIVHLIHCCLVTPYDAIDLGQNGLIAYRL